MRLTESCMRQAYTKTESKREKCKKSNIAALYASIHRLVKMRIQQKHQTLKCEANVLSKCAIFTFSNCFACSTSSPQRIHTIVTVRKAAKIRTD